MPFTPQTVHLLSQLTERIAVAHGNVQHVVDHFFRRFVVRRAEHGIFRIEIIQARRLEEDAFLLRHFDGDVRQMLLQGGTLLAIDSVQPSALLGLVAQSNRFLARVVASLFRHGRSAGRRRQVRRELAADAGEILVHFTFEFVLLIAAF